MTYKEVKIICVYMVSGSGWWCREGTTLGSTQWNPMVDKVCTWTTCTFMAQCVLNVWELGVCTRKFFVQRLKKVKSLWQCRGQTRRYWMKLLPEGVPGVCYGFLALTYFPSRARCSTWRSWGDDKVTYIQCNKLLTQGLLLIHSLLKI